MRIRAKICNIEDWFVIDTGFSGEVMTNYEVFNEIPFPTFDAGDICVTEGEC